MELSRRVLNSVRLSRGSMVLAGLDRFVCSSPLGRMEYELADTSTVDALLSRQNSMKSGDVEEKAVLRPVYTVYKVHGNVVHG